MKAKLAAIVVISVAAALILLAFFTFMRHSTSNASSSQHYNINSSQVITANGKLFINYLQQLNTSKSLGYNFTTASFYCGQSSDCELVQLAPCDNNLPNQFGCINPAAYPSYAIHKAAISKNAICPLFIERGNESCVCASSFCEEVYSP
ncbi:MAG: hypothetical protein ACP5NE_03175 [Candidatus Micrarchaeia archaeon]